MTPLHGLQTAGAAPEKREPSRDSGDPARALDLYAAWNAIFDSASPSAAEPPRLAADQRPGASGNRGVAAGSPAFLGARTATARAGESPAAQVRTWTAAQSAVALAATSAAASKRLSDPLARQNVAAEIVPLAGKAASAATREAANVAVRIHYLGPDCAQSADGPPSEVVSIVLEGAQVSIIVRNGGLSEAEALRTAFDTARELTGRPSSLQLLTLNGRVLYEQATRSDVAPGGFLFA